MQVSRNAVVYRRNEIGVRQWLTLVVGDGNQWHVAEAAIERLEIPQILPAVKRGQGPSSQRAEKREMEQIDMKMKDVEFIGALAHLRIETKRPSTTGGQLRAGDGISACKQRHIVAKPDKFFGQVGNDPLGAAIETRRNALN